MKSHEIQTKGRFLSSMDDIVSDAQERLSELLGRDIWFEDIDIYSWPQSWPNTTCGFGGIGGQAFTTAQTVVVGEGLVSCVVYHAGRFAYLIEHANDKFARDFDKHQLLGASNDWHIYDRKYEREVGP